jgi:4'-phosphopantetheinyl transferase
VVQRIYGLNIHSVEKDKARLVALLDEERRERLGTLHGEDALRSLAGGLLMRYIADGKPIRYSATGKPFVEGGPFFSVSHAGDYAAAVVSPNAPVGIDIENTENVRGGDFLPLAKKAFHPEELLYFTEKPDRRRFYAIWTQKEAFVKMRGSGIGGGLSTFNVLRFSPRREAGGEPQTAYTRLFRDVAPYIIAVCAAEPITAESVEVLHAESFG